MTELVAALLQFAVFSQNSMHATNRTEIDSFVQQGGIDLSRSLVLKAFRVHTIQHCLTLGGQQGASRRRSSRQRFWRDSRLQAAIPGSSCHAHGTTGGCLAYARSQQFNSAHSFPSSIGVSGIGFPNRAASFFWTSMISSAFSRRLVKRALAATSFRFSSTRG